MSLRQSWTFLIFLALVVAVTFGAGHTAAQTLYPTPRPFQGYAPNPTPNAANVIVIPPSNDANTFSESILANPEAFTPVPTSPALVNRSAPPGFISAGATAIVLSGPLNVRSEPNTAVSNVVLVQLQRGHDVTVLQYTPDLTWAFVDTRGPDYLQGWVFSEYLALAEDFQPFPPSLPDDTASTEYVLRARQNVNIRQSPTIFSTRVGLLPAGATAEIIGRTGSYSWWKIRDGETVGWVAATWIYVENPAGYTAPELTE
jgi:uncharacterized protein YraI